MSLEIRTISLPLPYRLGHVNCYLVRAGSRYLLIDTGSSNSRAALESELTGAGCGPGELGLIVLTHGDFDHSGNAAALRQRCGAPVAMHYDDVGMVTRGDMFWHRQSGNALVRWLAPLLFRFRGAQRFEPDLLVEDGTELSGYGVDARVIHLPGHSRGSIGILTAAGDLFCGDLLENSRQPGLNSIMDDVETGQASLEALQGLGITTVYPGHGSPFPLSRLTHETR
jgi:hydroxyacylglutathione hydrolase